MMLWLIERTDEVPYGDYDGMVVAAETEEDAIAVSRKNNLGCRMWVDGQGLVFKRIGGEIIDGWATPKHLEVTLIGTSVDNEPGVILYSQTST